MSTWVCGACRLNGDHGNHDDDGCTLTGSPGSGTRCACEWREDAIDAIAVPLEELPALITEDGYYPLPDYVADMTRVLLASEDHADAMVRDIRKIAVQAIAALHRMGVLDDAIDEPEATALPLAADVLGDLMPKPRRKTSASVELMQAHGVTAADVREWARGEGRYAPDRGALALELVQAYIDAQAAA